MRIIMESWRVSVVTWMVNQSPGPCWELGMNTVNHSPRDYVVEPLKPMPEPCQEVSNMLLRISNLHGQNF